MDHHVAVELALCIWVAKADLLQVFATFNEHQLGFADCYFLPIFAIVVGVLDMQVSFNSLIITIMNQTLRSKHKMMYITE